MSNRKVAQLGSLVLPPQFSYTPYVPRKRISTTPTARGVVVQSADPWIVHGDGTVSFTCPAMYPWEWSQLSDLYRDTPLQEYTFLGYWGETLTVMFVSLDQPRVRGRLFDTSGMLQVIDEPTKDAATCRV